MFKIVLILLFACLVFSQNKTVTALVYADNYFDFYVDGQLIKSDPLDFRPHNAVRFSFSVVSGVPRTYAIRAKDWTNPDGSGYEYTLTTSPQIGSGALRVLLSDGTVSSSLWKCYSTNFAPTDASNAAGCSKTNLKVCNSTVLPEPTGWTLKSFDDSAWKSATVYTEAQAGWGAAPTYQNGQCGNVVDPLTRIDKSPNYITSTADECVSPRDQSWSSSSFIWGSDIDRDNTILCRLTVSSSNTVIFSIWIVALILFFF